MINNIVVVGGGTSGWLTALYIRKILPDSLITLIESSEYGILGAGEGTTPQFVDLMFELGIPLQDVFKNADATFKNGIKFTNWNGDNTSYFHPFLDTSIREPTKEQIFYNISKKINLDNLYPSPTLSYSFKVKARPNPAVNQIDPYQLDGGVGLHFDARKLALLLKNVGIDRDIQVVDNIVTNFHTDENGYITSVELKTKDIIKCDFIFDCSGFRRLIIGKFFNAEWTSYKKNIPNTKAVPFFIEHDNELLPPYTEAIAMDHGWVWKIPTQTRYGCGYVFDDTSVDDDTIKKEVREKFGIELDLSRKFTFEAGAYKTPWIKNCLAVGLSAGFIEPLEATSIWVQIMTLKTFKIMFRGALLKDQPTIDLFNTSLQEINEIILSFIYLHYITKKNDTPYWADFKDKNLPPPTFEKFQELTKSTLDVFSSLAASPFRILFNGTSVYAVGAGGHFFNPALAHAYLITQKFFEPGLPLKLNALNESISKQITRINKQSIPHNIMIKIMNGEYED